MPGAAHRFATTRSDTRAVTIDAPVDDVFAFLADPENLPRWAVAFCRSIRCDDDGDRWIVTTAGGDIPIRYNTSRTLGVIDFHLSPAPGVEAVAFSRVMPNGDVHVLGGVMRARAACPAVEP